MGEDADSRISWDAGVPFKAGERSIKATYQALRDDMAVETRYSREGFFPMMLYERFKADDLAGLVDDGKVPLAKMVIGFGGTHTTLWQDQLDQEWGYEAADLSISQQVPLKEVDGKLIMSVGG